MTTKQTLPELLESSSDKKFLFLGREGLFTQDEIARFLKKYDITMTKYLEEDTFISFRCNLGLLKLECKIHFLCILYFILILRLENFVIIH